MTSIDTVVGTTMKVTCGRDELTEKLQLAGRGVSTRTNVQILAGIMLRVAGGQLHLSATDMEISLRVALDAQVEDEGAVVVPGRLLVDTGDRALDERLQGYIRVRTGPGQSAIMRIAA